MDTNTYTHPIHLEILTRHEPQDQAEQSRGHHTAWGSPSSATPMSPFGVKSLHFHHAPFSPKYLFFP